MGPAVTNLIFGDSKHISVAALPDGVNTGSDTVFIRPITLPADASETGVTAVGVTHVPSDVDVYKCRDCGCVHIPTGVTSAAFVRTDRKAGEWVVARSLRDWLQSRRPGQVVVAASEDRNVIEDLFDGDLPAVIGNITVSDLDGGADRITENIDHEDRPVLRGTSLMPVDVRDVGLKIVRDDDPVQWEVSAIRRAAIVESRYFVQVLASC